jgi:hypothetical protein
MGSLHGTRLENKSTLFCHWSWLYRARIFKLLRIPRINSREMLISVFLTLLMFFRKVAGEKAALSGLESQNFSRSTLRNFFLGTTTCFNV